jgi:pyruvate dehydrogenase E2 component (dihydrolipoamide acetyltransferase)
VRTPGESAAAPPAAPPPIATATATVSARPGPAVPSPAGPPAAAATRARVTPAARRRARELGVDADALHGSAADGAVSLADVERAAAASGPAAVQAAPAGARAIRSGFDPAQMRQAIATAMSRSKREIPHYYLTSTVDFHAAEAWLEAFNAERGPAERLLPATLLLKACALALRELPQFNGLYQEGRFQPGSGVHVGWAIALRGGGLVAPAIHDADRRTLPELMAALRDLVQRARSGGLRSSELSDPTVTVTSLGDRGADSVLGVIYPPQVAIIGFGQLLLRPWVVDGEIVARRVVTLSLAADHRVSDGHLGGQMLAAIGAALQQPGRL